MISALIPSVITLGFGQLVGLVLVTGGASVLLGIKFGRAIERTEAEHQQRIARRYR